MYDKRIPPGKILGKIEETEWINKSPLTGQTTIFPRTITLEDIDKSVFDWFNSKEIYFDNKGGKKIPVFFLSQEKWAEFKQRWQYMDSDRVVDFPYITIRRNAVSPAKQPIKGRIPGKTFTTFKLPVHTNSGPTFKHYKIPQPIKIDLSYEVRILTHYISETNTVNELLLRHFASLQAYLNIDKHYMPMMIDSINDESENDNIVDERIMHTLYSIQVKGYIIDESEFEEKLGISDIIVKIKEETN